MRETIKYSRLSSLLTDTSLRRTPLQNGHLELVSAFFYSLYLTLYETGISLFLKGVCL